MPSVKEAELNAMTYAFNGTTLENPILNNEREHCDGSNKQCSDVHTTQSLDISCNLEFYGQRLWRQGIQCIEPPDLIKEREGILNLQITEFSVDQSVSQIYLKSFGLSIKKSNIVVF